jgi:hypothetical protein
MRQCAPCLCGKFGDPSGECGAERIELIDFFLLPIDGLIQRVEQVVLTGQLNFEIFQSFDQFHGQAFIGWIAKVRRRIPVNVVHTAR